MGDVVFEKTENGLVPHSAWAGCSSHFLLEDLPNLRKRNPMNPGNYKSFMVHMSRLRLFSIDKHFVKAWEIIKAYWASKGETKLPHAVEASMFGKEGSKRCWHDGECACEWCGRVS